MDTISKTPRVKCDIGMISVRLQIILLKSYLKGVQLIYSNMRQMNSAHKRMLALILFVHHFEYHQ